mmetsp:Transcript_78315/g.175560  ORF Transcript_78315/g.175560 Transcript_78315/m.175560 type:complete len:200 (-) Transcript_78315:1123-1722(-)
MRARSKPALLFAFGGARSGNVAPGTAAEPAGGCKDGIERTDDNLTLLLLPTLSRVLPLRGHDVSMEALRRKLPARGGVLGGVEAPKPLTGATASGSLGDVDGNREVLALTPRASNGSKRQLPTLPDTFKGNLRRNEAEGGGTIECITGATSWDGPQRTSPPTLLAWYPMSPAAPAAPAPPLPPAPPALRQSAASRAASV